MPNTTDVTNVTFCLQRSDRERMRAVCDEEHIRTGTYARACVLKDLAKRGY